MTDAERLRESYFHLRRASPALRRASHAYQGRPWFAADSMQCRNGSDGSELRVYEIEGGIEACIISPDGQSESWA